MAFGISPKYIQDYPLNDLEKEHFLVLAIEAATKIEWNVSFISENGFVAYSGFSWTSWSEEITVKIENGIANLKSECTGNQLMDWGKNKKNVETLLSKIEELKTSMSQQDVETKLSEVRQSYASKEDDILNKPSLTSKEKLSGIFSIFKPTEGYFISPILININILVFIIMVISGVHILMPENQDLINWGANFRPSTLEGQWWRLFTCCFLHIGIFHLLLNMYALLYIGLLLEPYLGKTRFLAAYIISGIAASMASLWWHDFTVSAGASGAIFGMYGVFLALLTTNLLDKSLKKALLASIAVFVAYNLMNGLKPNSGVDNAAHIGGLLTGLLIGYAFVPSLKQYENKTLKLSAIGVLTTALVISSFVLIRTLPNDIGIYDQKMKEFVSMESMALEVYRLPEGTTNEKILSEIKTRGLYYWKENIKLLDSFSELNLPELITERNRKLREYCELRIKSYEVIYKAIEENTDNYKSQIEEYNQKIEKIIAELSGK